MSARWSHSDIYGTCDDINLRLHKMVRGLFRFDCFDVDVFSRSTQLNSPDA